MVNELARFMKFLFSWLNDEYMIEEMKMVEFL